MEIYLKPEDKKQISQWIGGRLKYSLLYKASVDGCSATAFHEKCDDRGPTVTVLYNTDKSVFGGYTSLNWDSSGAYKNDSKAFLFRLYYNGNWHPAQMKVNDSKKATFCKASYGPTFGGGYDLLTFSGTITFFDTYFPLNGKTKFGTSYTMNGEDYNSIANGHLQVIDMEVYLAQALHLNEPLEEPWLHTDEWNVKFMNELKEKIASYQPKKDYQVPHAHILMIGQVSAGKSSFFNTINSIFRGRIANQAPSGYATHSLTSEYRIYQIKSNTSDKPLNFRLHDTIGLEPNDKLEVTSFCYLLDGSLPPKHQYSHTTLISPNNPDLEKNPKLCDKIHCVAIVVDGSTVEFMRDEIVDKIKKLQKQLNSRGIPQVVLLTKIDKICEITLADLSKLRYSAKIQETVDRVSQIMGLPRSQILPVKNYESERRLTDHINILALMNLLQMLEFADDYMDGFMDRPKEEKRPQLNIKE